MVRSSFHFALGFLCLSCCVDTSDAVEPDSRYCVSTSAHLGPIYLMQDPLIERLRRSRTTELSSLERLRSILGKPDEEKTTLDQHDLEWNDGEMELEVSIDCKAPYDGSRHNHYYVVRHYQIKVVANGDLVRSCVVSTSTQFSKEPWPFPKYGSSPLDKIFSCARTADEVGLR